MLTQRPLLRLKRLTTPVRHNFKHLQHLRVTKPLLRNMIVHSYLVTFCAGKHVLNHGATTLCSATKHTHGQAITACFWARTHAGACKRVARESTDLQMPYSRTWPPVVPRRQGSYLISIFRKTSLGGGAHLTMGRVFGDWRCTSRCSTERAAHYTHLHHQVNELRAWSRRSKSL